MLVMEEVQVARVTRFRVLPSPNVPIAVNCRLVPLAMEGVAGRTLIEVRLDRFTVSNAFPLTDGPVGGNVAVMVAVPNAFPIAKPLFVVTKAILGADEAHVETLVMSC
jgi:hypothetical protein